MNWIRVVNIVLELEFVKLATIPFDWEQDVSWKGMEQQILFSNWNLW